MLQSLSNMQMPLLLEPELVHQLRQEFSIAAKDLHRISASLSRNMEAGI